jgi:hypothetical protein
MSDQRWTAETLELVASRGAGSCAAADILDALADAGLLVQPGSIQTHDWAALIWRDDQEPSEGLIDTRPTRRDAEGVVRIHAEMRADPNRNWVGRAQLLRRVVYTGPWIDHHDPALPGPASPVERGPAHDPPPNLS